MSEGGLTHNSTINETFESIMNRRLMKYTMEIMNQPIKIKLKNSNKVYSGILHAFDPISYGIVVQHFMGADDRADFKVIGLKEIDFFSAEAGNQQLEEQA